jgi:hypothetical protein
MEIITKKTKIVCTIGPASDTPEMIYKLYEAGMNVMRVNFSHGTHEEQLAKIKIARSLREEVRDLHPRRFRYQRPGNPHWLHGKWLRAGQKRPDHADHQEPHEGHE